MFSREAANSAFRRCAENTTIAEVASCLQVVNGEITTQGNAILPGLNLILSVYRLEPSGCDLSAGACSDPPMSAINPLVADQVIPIKTRYELSDFAIGGKYNQLLNENRVIAISEVFFNYEPLIPVIGQIFYPGGTLLYDTTLF